MSAARWIDGVEAVLLPLDLPHVPLVDVLPIEGLLKTPQHALATVARFAGEPVALVLGVSRYEAEDATISQGIFESSSRSNTTRFLI